MNRCCGLATREKVLPYGWLLVSLTLLSIDIYSLFVISLYGEILDLSVEIISITCINDSY